MPFCRALALISVLFFSVAGHAGDFCCGSVFPSAPTAVRLASEDVKLRLDGAQVEADATLGLENAGGAAALELNLPFQAGAKAALGIADDEPDSIQDLEVELEGNPVACSPAPSSATAAARYVWKLALEPNSAVELRVRYHFDLKTDAEGVSRLSYAWGRSEAWVGADSAEFDIDLGRAFPPCYLTVSPTAQSYQNGHLHWSLPPSQRIDISVGLEEKRGDQFSMIAWKALNPASLGADEAQMLKNTVFALRGKVFKSRTLNRHLMAQDWYRPRSDYSDKLLTHQEWDVVAALGQRVARAKGQRVGKK